jgi:hypothetical protein
VSIKLSTEERSEMGHKVQIGKEKLPFSCGTDPIIIHPNTELKATGNVSPTETRLPSNMSANRSAYNSISIVSGTINNRSAKVRFLYLFTISSDSGCPGIFKVKEGSTQALNLKIGSTKNLGCIKQFTNPCTFNR